MISSTYHEFMGRERRNTPLPESMPETESVAKPKTISQRFEDLADLDTPVVLKAPKLPKEAPARSHKKTRRGPYEANKPPASLEASRTESGVIDMTEHAVLDEEAPSSNAHEEPEAPRKKRAPRKMISKEVVAEAKAPVAKSESGSTDEMAKRQQQWDADKAEHERQRLEKTAKAEARKKRIADLATKVDKTMAEEDLAEYVAAHPEYRPIPTFNEKEEAWFKQGEDESYVKNLAEKQQIEDRQKISELRDSLKGSYDQASRDTIIDTDEEVEAAAKQAEAMIASGELNPQLFNAKDYRYFLIEKARLDRELETAGWWQARKLRAELKEAQKQLSDYEQQIHSVHGERYAKMEAPTTPLRAPRAAREGSGTTLNKPGFFARLFGKK